MKKLVVLLLVLGVSQIASATAMLYELDQTPVTGAGAIIDHQGTTSGTMINTSVMPTVVAGARSYTGNAWSFAGGSTASIEVASNAFLQSLGNVSTTTGMSVGFWVKTNTTTSDRPFGMQGVSDDYTTNWPSSATLYMQPGVGGTSTRIYAEGILNDQWHHVVYTLDFTSTTNNEKLYVDGVLINTTYGGPKSYSFATSFAGSSNFVIGARGTTFNYGLNNWKGALDDLIVTNYALSGTDVAQLMNVGAANFIPEPATMGLLGLGAFLIKRTRRS